MLKFSEFIFFTSFFLFTKQCNAMKKVNVSRSESMFLSSLVTNNLPIKNAQLFNENSILDVIVADNTETDIKNGIIRLFANNIPVVLHSASADLLDTYDHSKISSVIGIYSQTTDVDLNMWITYFNNRWNPRSKIIVWITHPSSTNGVESLLRRFWHHECMNVVIIVQDKSKSQHKLYSYDPFFNGDSKKRGRMYTLSEDDDFFINKMKNLHGYEIKISIFHRPPYSVLLNNEILVNGTEVEVIKAMSCKFNFTPILVTSKADAINYVIQLKNGSEEGPLGDLIINRSEMLGNAFYINLVIAKKVEFIIPFTLSDYVAVVPKNMGQELIVQVSHHLKNPFYMMVFASFCALAIYLHFKKDKHCILTSWYLLLFLQFRKFDDNYCDKCIRLTWIFWATIISSLYQGVLYKYLSTPNSESDINTLRELYNSDLELKVGEAMLSPIQSSEDYYKRKLAERATVILKLEDCYDEFQKYQNISCAADRNFAMYYFRELLSNDPTAHIVKEPLNSLWVTFIVKDGFPFISLLHFTVYQLIENGFFAKWRTDSKQRLGLVSFEPPLDVGPLGFSYFKITFYALYVGIFIATVVFFTEITITYIKRKDCILKNKRELCKNDNKL